MEIFLPEGAYHFTHFLRFGDKFPCKIIHYDIMHRYVLPLGGTRTLTQTSPI